MAQKTTAQTNQESVTDTDQKQLYGLYVMIHPSSDEPSVQKLHASLCDIIKKQGEIQESKECVKQELSFPIQKSIFAYTATIYFIASSQNIATINQAVKTVDGPLLRFVLTKESHIPTPESEMVAPEEEKETPTRADSGTPTQPAQEPASNQDKSKITIEDIDKKLDEIMGNV